MQHSSTLLIPQMAGNIDGEAYERKVVTQQEVSVQICGLLCLHQMVHRYIHSNPTVQKDAGDGVWKHILRICSRTLLNG